METDRLLLRPWREDDGVELQHLWSDPAVRGGRNLPDDRIARIAEGSLRQWRVNGFGPWAAIDKAASSWIGKIGLDELDDWPDVDKIEAGISVTAVAHAAARRVMEKAGLTFRGTRYWMNPEVPVVWYAIDRAAWRPSP